MKIVFMGTPLFAVASLEALIKAGHEVCAVFTRADRPTGRKMKMTPPPVKSAAEGHHIPVYQPKTWKDGAGTDILRDLQPDAAVVAAYGRILPPEVLTLPRFGCINVHASLLPKYRGASPIQAAILHGEKETGISIMKMDEGLDTGDILYTAKIPVEPDETYGSLNDRLKELGAGALCEALSGLESGRLTPVPQDASEASYAPLIQNKDAQVRFTADEPAAISAKLRAFDPAPGGFALLNGQRIRLFRPEIRALCGTPGKILGVDRQGALVACSIGSVLIGELQPPGGKRMPAVDFFRGRPALADGVFE